jgi:hypothetical protein
MKYEIIEKQNVTIIHVFEGNIFFGYDESEDYDSFRVALNTKGIDVFVDLLIQDSNTAYLNFING